MLDDDRPLLRVRLNGPMKEDVVVVVPDGKTAAEYGEELRKGMPEWVQVWRERDDHFSDDFVRGDLIYRIYVAA